MVIRCHSSFEHYNMFHNHHRHCGGNNYGSVFNIKYNCSGGHTNFWGGLGFGLGAGLGNWCGGWLNNIMGGMGNWFSPFGAMMPGIMQSFGYGGYNMPWASNYGNQDRFSRYDSSNSKYNSGNSCDCKSKVNNDKEPIDKLWTRFYQLNEDSPENDINRLRSELEAKMSNLDGVEDSDDRSRIENMLTHLPKAKSTAVKGQGKEAKVVVEEEGAFDPTKGTADGGLGCKEVSDAGASSGTKVYSLPSVINYENLKKLEGQVVAPAHNPKAGEDQYIYGEISHVEKDENGVLSYVIDCKDYGVFKQKYTVKQSGPNSTTWKIDLHKDSQFEALCLGYGWAEREYTYDAKTQMLKRDNERTVLTAYKFIECLESYVKEHSNLTDEDKAKLIEARNKFIEKYNPTGTRLDKLNAIVLEAAESNS